MMTPEFRKQLKAMLIKHEGYSKFPYTDTVGKITIGVGYNLTDRGLPDAWINAQLDTDIDYFYDRLSNTFSWFEKLDDIRKFVLVDMCFMGFKRFLEFKNTIAALARGDYYTAAAEMLDSKWATQVKGRAIELAEMMRHGMETNKNGLVNKFHQN